MILQYSLHGNHQKVLQLELSLLHLHRAFLRNNTSNTETATCHITQHRAFLATQTAPFTCSNSLCFVSDCFHTFTGYSISNNEADSFIWDKIKPPIVSPFVRQLYYMLPGKFLWLMNNILFYNFFFLAPHFWLFKHPKNKTGYVPCCFSLKNISLHLQCNLLHNISTKPFMAKRQRTTRSHFNWFKDSDKISTKLPNKSAWSQSIPTQSHITIDVYDCAHSDSFSKCNRILHRWIFWFNLDVLTWHGHIYYSQFA